MNKSTVALSWTCCLCTVGQVVYMLPEGPPVHGVTSLADEVFLLRNKEQDQLEVYDATTYRLQRCLSVPNCRGIIDMTSCEHYLCVYVSDDMDKCIHRLDSQGKAAAQWPINDEPVGLSVNRAHNLLVTCWLVRKIKEFSTHGDLLREIKLPDDVIMLLHAIQLTSGQFLVCHGSLLQNDPVHRVCVISADGRQIDHSLGGQPGSDTDECNVPCQLAVDQNECVYVVDRNNRRVKLLSPTLGYIRDVVTSNSLKCRPNELCLVTQAGRLYVTDVERKDDKYTAGRVVVFSV